MTRLTLQHFNERLLRLTAEHVHETKIARNRIGADAMRANAYGGSRMELAMYEEILGRFRQLAVVLLSELHAAKHRLNAVEAEAGTLAMLRDAASTFGDMAIQEAPTSWGGPRNAMGARLPEFDALVDVLWRDYKAGLLFPSAPTQLPWFQRPAGLIGLGILIAVVSGIVVAALT